MQTSTIIYYCYLLSIKVFQFSVNIFYISSALFLFEFNPLLKGLYCSPTKSRFKLFSVCPNTYVNGIVLAECREGIQDRLEKRLNTYITH